MTVAWTDTQDAYIYVELDIVKPRMERIWIGEEGKGFWQPIVYYKVSDLCSYCHRLGHSEKECHKRAKQNQKFNEGTEGQNVKRIEGFKKPTYMSKNKQVYRPMVNQKVEGNVPIANSFQALEYFE